MSVTKSLAKIGGAVVAAAVVGALSLAPVAGISGVAIARTNETMESNLADLTDGTAPGVTTITDSTGEPMAWVFDQRRHEVDGDEISQHMKDAIVAIEDHRFYEHDGVDMQGTARAMLTNVLAGGVEQGASTLNQQYVKNFLLLVAADDDAERAAAVEQSVPRKLREMRMASDLDQNLSKDEILTRYLNLVPFGNHAYGIEAAARTYFGISAAELNVPQSAMLAGMVQSSEALNPYTNPEGATERRNTVLQSMVTVGYIDQATADAHKQEPLGVLDLPATLPNGCIAADNSGFFCDYALTYLDSKGLSREELSTGGYTVTTTLDPQVQQAAHQAAVSHVNPDQPGVAEVINVIEPGQDSRDILAMTSSRDYGLNLEEGETMLPQPSSMVGNGAGSIFKIFTAAVAIDQGMGLDTMLDVPARYEARGLGSGGAANCPANTYCVENAGTYAPRMTLAEALAHSPNTTFVQLIEEVGVDAVVDMSVALGLRSYEVPGSHDGERSIAEYMKEANLGSYTLGPTAVNPLELSNVGATIASGGRWCEPNPIESVVDREGNEVFLERPACEDVVDTDVANALSVGMAGDIEYGTAAAAAGAMGWSGELAAKTGTTESNQSSAFLAFNSNISAAPYIYNDGTNTTPLCTSPVRQCSTGSLYGGLEPARSWFAMANQLPEARQGTLPQDDPRYGQGAAQQTVSSATGLTEAEARRLLEDQGYQVTTRTVAGNGTPRGHVLRALPEGGTLGPGGMVILEVSDGTRPAPEPQPEAGRGNGGESAPSRQDSPARPQITQDDIDQFTNRLLDAFGL
ncbi:transglycosylase domain-containing protein [Corynebacterium halotolerans]|nr:transglycosylase domain-containing protein [Corynebacterium halotolerans]